MSEILIDPNNPLCRTKRQPLVRSAMVLHAAVPHIDDAVAVASFVRREPDQCCTVEFLIQKEVIPGADRERVCRAVETALRLGIVRH